MFFLGFLVVILYVFNEFMIYIGGNEILIVIIWGFLKKYEIIWKKDNQKLNIIDLKYKGIKNDDRYFVLYINNIKKEDEGIYMIEVNNEMGKG